MSYAAYLFQPKKQAQEGHIMDIWYIYIWYMIYIMCVYIYIYRTMYIYRYKYTFFPEKKWDFGSSFGNHLSVDPIHPLNAWSPKKKKRTCAATKATPFEAWSVHWFRRWTEVPNNKCGEKSVESQGLKEEWCRKLNQTVGYTPKRNCWVWVPPGPSHNLTSTKRKLIFQKPLLWCKLWGGKSLPQQWGGII